MKKCWNSFWLRGGSGGSWTVIACEENWKRSILTFMYLSLYYFSMVGHPCLNHWWRAEQVHLKEFVESLKEINSKQGSSVQEAGALALNRAFHQPNSEAAYTKIGQIPHMSTTIQILGQNSLAKKIQKQLKSKARMMLRRARKEKTRMQRKMRTKSGKRTKGTRKAHEPVNLSIIKPCLQRKKTWMPTKLLVVCSPPALFTILLSPTKWCFDRQNSSKISINYGYGRKASRGRTQTSTKPFERNDYWSWWQRFLGQAFWTWCTPTTQNLISRNQQINDAYI